MITRKTIIWTIVAFLFLGGIVYFPFLRKPKVEYVTTDVSRGSVRETVTATGTLKADDTILLNFETAGRIKDIRIRTGQKIAKGDILAVIDDSNLQLAADQARANLAKARADAGANSDAIHTAEVAVDNAEKFLEDTKRLNKANLEAAEQVLEDARDKLDDAESFYDAVKDESGAGSSTAKSAKLTLDTAKASANEAEKALDVADQQADLNETSAENSLASAKANLRAAESDFVSAGADAVAAGFQAAYETALNNLDKAALRAPASGIVKKVNFKTGEVLGSSVLTNPFAEMISFDFILEAKVAESDIAKVKLGQGAEVAFDAFSADEKFRAAVASIDPSSTITQDVVDYIVKLAMEKDDLRWKDGMSADVDILIEEKTGVLSVPERAVKSENGKQFVDILVDGKRVERRGVITGLKGDGGAVEVISGLEEGEKVITSAK